MSLVTIELTEWTMSETQATDWTQYEEVAEALSAPSGWSAEPPATAATVSGAEPRQDWATPIGIPIPLPPPAPPAATPPATIVEALASLPRGWHTLPSERIGVADFEHIVIGPAGVFTIASAPNSDGDRAQAAATKATRFLDQAGLVDIQVQAVMVFVGTELQPVDSFDVIVATLDDVSRTISSLPATLTPLQVQSARNLAERPDTWIERVPAKG
jgi:hypothetical protein